jgi:hypothetical protein
MFFDTSGESAIPVFFSKCVCGAIVAARGRYGVQIGPIDAPWCGGGDGLGFG